MLQAIYIVIGFAPAHIVLPPLPVMHVRIIVLSAKKIKGQLPDGPGMRKNSP